MEAKVQIEINLKSDSLLTFKDEYDKFKAQKGGRDT